MSEVITDYGDLAGICGHDGTSWVKVKVGAGGALQIDTESTANPSNLDIAISALRDALAGATPNTSTLYALSTLLTEIQARLGDEASPAAGSVNAQLAALLTELQQKLETSDLNLDASKDLQVDVKTAPTTAVTIADAADVAIGAVADAVVAAGAVGTLSAKLRRLTTDLDALLTELKLKADLTETQPVSIATMPTTTVQAGGGDKIFSFESIVEEALVNASLSAGNSYLTGTAVAAGKVWQLNNLTMKYAGTPPTRIYVQAMGLALGMMLIDKYAPDGFSWYVWSGQMYMQAGDYIQAAVLGATAGDQFYCRYAGVQMDAPA